MVLPDRAELERVLCQLKGVEGARVCVQGEEIVEVHVAGAPGNRPKNIARDVRSYLAAALGIEISHKKISVAVRRGSAPELRGHAGGEGPPPEGRVRFGAVNLSLEGLSAEVQVQLIAGEQRLSGQARGVQVGHGVERLIVEATLTALGGLLESGVRLVAGEVRGARLGLGGVVLVEVLLLRRGGERRLVGACPRGAEGYRAFVFATLAAVNRILPDLARTRWTEVRVEEEMPEPESEEGP